MTRLLENSCAILLTLPFIYRNSLRRSASRFLSSPISVSTRPTSIPTPIPSYLAPSIALRWDDWGSFQRRWTSDETASQRKRASGDINAATADVDAERTKGTESSTEPVKEGPVEPAESENNLSAGTSVPLVGNAEVNSDTRSYIPGESVVPKGRQHIKGRQATASFSTPPPSNNVYVGNLFYDTTSEGLRKQFEKYGIVQRATIIHDTRGLSKGFGYVTFDSVGAARNAVEGMHLRVFDGRRLYVEFAVESLKNARIKKKPSKLLYIGNLMYDMTDRDLNDLFKDLDNFVDIRIAVDRRTGQLCGFAHAEFLDTDSAMVAYEILSQKAPYGKKLNVEYSEKKIKWGGGKIARASELRGYDDDFL